MKNLLSVLFCFLMITGYSQEFFMVELEARSPSVMDQVKQYEGFPVIPFMANDLDGVEQTNFKYRDAGKSMLIWFWELGNPVCEEMLPFMNKMQAAHADKMQIVSFASDPKAEVSQYLVANKMDFPVIPDSKMFAEGPYGGDLGYPRLFFVDSYGVTRWVLPAQSQQNQVVSQKFVEALINQLVKI